MMRIVRPEWHSQRRCVNKHPDDFVTNDTWKIIFAKRLCATCPVKQQCLEAALENGEVGVWGGTTEQERRHLLRAG